MPHIVALRSITVLCSNAVSAQEFYVDALGFPIIDKRFVGNPAHQEIRLNACGIVLNLICGQVQMPPQFETGITLEVADLDGFIQHLAKYEIEPIPVPSAPDSRPKMRTVYICDPDGRILLLTESP